MHRQSKFDIVTACLSTVTAIALWPVVPKLLALPSPAKMAKLIVEQQATATRLRDSERRFLLAGKALRTSNDILEHRVIERTAELNRVNAAITRSENRFRRVVEAARSAMIMVNAAGQIEMVNEQAERMFGYTRAQMLGSAVEILMPTAFRTGHPSLHAGFAADPATRAMGAGAVLFGQRSDGSEFELEIGLSPIETDEGMMVLSVVVDISARVLMEAQLRQSQKMEAIGRVAAGVAHDFNNLLQALNGSLELLLDDVADRLKLNAVKMKIIVQLLDYWRKPEQKPSPSKRELVRRLKGVNPEAYLMDVPTRIAERHPINRIDELLHWRINKPPPGQGPVTRPHTPAPIINADSQRLRCAHFRRRAAYVTPAKPRPPAVQTGRTDQLVRLGEPTRRTQLRSVSRAADLARNRANSSRFSLSGPCRLSYKLVKYQRVASTKRNEDGD